VHEYDHLEHSMVLDAVKLAEDSMRVRQTNRRISFICAVTSHQGEWVNGVKVNSKAETGSPINLGLIDQCTQKGFYTIPFIRLPYTIHHLI